MATKIRLKRIGRRNRPFYRMVVMDSRSRRDGAAIEELGWYNPIDLDHSFSLKEDRILYWLKEGAQTTDATHKLLKKAGVAHKWHLINQGLDDTQVKKEMQKWKLNQDEVLKSRLIKESKVDADNIKTAKEKDDVSSEEE